MTRRGLIVGLLVVLLPASCSVKEDRSSCPCWLDLALSGGAEREVDLWVWDGAPVREETASLEGGQALARLEIPRGRLQLVAWSGLHACRTDGENICMLPGEEMDELYAAATPLDARGDRAEASVTLHKQFVRVHLGIVGTDSASYPFRIEIRGEMRGFSLPDLRPLPGGFRVALTPVIGTYHRVVLPRQQPGSRLVLAFYEAGGGTAPQAEFPLGESLEAAGYDWNKTNLDDVFLDVDYAEATLRIRIRDWETEEL